MQFRTSGQRDERRRRVCLEERSVDQADVSNTETSTTSDEPTRRSRTTNVAERYDAVSLMENQIRLVDLLPKRSWSVWLLGSCMLLIVAGLGYLHLQTTVLSHALGPEGIRALTIDDSNSIAVWLTSSLFITGSILSWQIYLLRRHRSDDYRGTYRIWLWAACVFMLASLDATTRFHVFVDRLIRFSAGDALIDHANPWWLVVAWVMFAVIAIRMLFELRESIACRFMLAGAFTAYMLSTLISINTLETEPLVERTFAEMITLLAGHVFVVQTLLCYGCFIYRDAHGEFHEKRQLRAAKRSERQKAAAERKSEKGKVAKRTAPRPKRKSKPDKETKASSPTAKPDLRVAATTEQKESKQRKKAGSKRLEASAASQEYSPSTIKMPSDDDEFSGLSKAEKRRLRKKSRRDLRKAA